MEEAERTKAGRCGAGDGGASAAAPRLLEELHGVVGVGLLVAVLVHAGQGVEHLAGSSRGVGAGLWQGGVQARGGRGSGRTQEGSAPAHPRQWGSGEAAGRGRCASRLCCRPHVHAPQLWARSPLSPSAHLLRRPRQARRVPGGRGGRRAGTQVPLLGVPLDAPRQQVHGDLSGACSGGDARWRALQLATDCMRAAKGLCWVWQSTRRGVMAGRPHNHRCVAPCVAILGMRSRAAAS